MRGLNGTGDANALPKGWEWSTIGAEGHVQLGRQRAPRYHQGPHMRPYLRVANVFEDQIDLSDVKEMDFSPEDYERYKLEPGDILLNEGQSPELLGRPAMYRGELPGACFTNSLIRYRVGPRLDADFALLAFRHYMHAGRFTRETRITTNIAHLSAGRFAAIELAVPPLEEQLKIVRSVRTLLGEIEFGETSIATTARLVERMRAAHLRSVARADGQRLRLDQIGTVYVGATPARSEPSFWGGAIPWVSSSEVAFNHITATREHITAVGLGNRERRLHPPGTVLVAMYGDGKTRGQAALLEIEAATNQAVAAIRLDLDKMSPQFLLYYFMDRYQEIRKAASGTQQKNLNKAAIQAIEVVCPPKEQQASAVTRVAAGLSATDLLRSQLGAANARAAALRRSLISAAVNGRLSGVKRSTLDTVLDEELAR